MIMTGSSNEISDVDEFNDYLSRMGDLHDCVIDAILWRPAEKRIEVRFADVKANFAGLPEYMGLLPCAMTVSGVDDVVLSVASTDGRLKVYEASASETTRGKLLKMRFSPSGALEASFTTVAVVELT